MKPALFLLLPLLLVAETISGKVVKVVDGEELEAKRAKRGLWSEPNPVSPWDFRRSSK